jgi:hypothetical protein
METCYTETNGKLSKTDHRAGSVLSNKNGSRFLESVREE